MHVKILAILYFLVGCAMGMTMFVAAEEIYVRLAGIFILIYLTYNVITQLGNENAVNYIIYQT